MLHNWRLYYLHLAAINRQYPCINQPVSLLTTQSPAALGAAQHIALLPRLLQLVLSYHLSARIMCEYTRDEWVNGLTR